MGTENWTGKPGIQEQCLDWSQNWGSKIPCLAWIDFLLKPWKALVAFTPACITSPSAEVFVCLPDGRLSILSCESPSFQPSAWAGMPVHPAFNSPEEKDLRKMVVIIFLTRKRRGGREKWNRVIPQISFGCWTLSVSLWLESLPWSNFAAMTNYWYYGLLV